MVERCVDVAEGVMGYLSQVGPDVKSALRGGIVGA